MPLREGIRNIMKHAATACNPPTTSGPPLLESSAAARRISIVREITKSRTDWQSFLRGGFMQCWG